MSNSRVTSPRHANNNYSVEEKYILDSFYLTHSVIYSKSSQPHGTCLLLIHNMYILFLFSFYAKAPDVSNIT